MLLTAAIVEDIQRAHRNGTDVRSIVSSISDATLSGLMEYACLRAEHQEFPALPPALLASSYWGSEFLRSSAHAGSRGSKNGLRQKETGRFDAFNAGVLESQQWETFQFYFTQASKASGLQSSVADALAAAMHEMAENAFLHSSATRSIVVGYRATNGESTFCVTDLGIGILASLKSNPQHAKLKRHSDAIRLALRDGVTRFPAGGGFGFRSIFKALVSQWGSLRFRSGEGCIEMDGMDLQADHGTVSFPPSLPGFQVSVTARSVADNT